MSQAAQQVELDRYQFATLDGQNALDRWEEAAPIIERALEHDYDGMTTNQILGRILLNDLTLIIVHDRETDRLIACMTLEYIKRFERICHCMTFSGDNMRDWVDQWMDVWRRIAIETNCQYLSIKGREGWQRYAAKEYGFTHAYTQMHLKVEVPK